MTLSAEDCRRAAELLLAARRDLSPIPALPGDCRPETAAEGYAVQAAVQAAVRVARGDELAGFKIGATSEVAQTLLATDGPFHGCLFAKTIHDSPATLPATLPAGAFNFRLIEPEFAFRLGADLPPRESPYARDEISDAVASLHPAFEVVSSAYGASWVEAGLAQLIADNGVHAGLVLGPGTEDWRGLDLAAHGVIFAKDGAEVGRGTGANALGHPLNALAWLADRGALEGRGLKAGDLVTTGLVTPFAYAEAGTVLRADYGPLGTVELRFSG